MKSPSLALLAWSHEGLRGWIPPRIGSDSTFPWLDSSTALYGSATQVGGSVRLIRGTAAGDSTGGYIRLSDSLRIPAGDFDLRLAYNLTSFPTPLASGRYSRFGTRIVDPALGGFTQSIAILRNARYSPSPYQTIYGYTTDTAAQTEVACPTDALATGKFRYIRSGTAVTAYYWTAGAWTALLNKNPCNTTPWEIRIWIGGYMGGGGGGEVEISCDVSDIVSVRKAAD